MGSTITALSVQKRNPQRVNVYLDGEFAFGLARLTAAWLTVGQVLSDEKVAQLRAEDLFETSYQHALRFVSYQPRTQAEIRHHLQQHDTPPESIDAILERLTQLGLVNDSQFAQAWVDNRNEFRPRSRRALSIELRRRGIEQQIIEDSLESLDDETLAYQAARKQAHRLAGMEWQAFRHKMYSFLARRGFSYEVSAPIVAQVWAEVHNDIRDDHDEEDDQ